MHAIRGDDGADAPVQHVERRFHAPEAAACEGGHRLAWSWRGQRRLCGSTRRDATRHVSCAVKQQAHQTCAHTGLFASSSMPRPRSCTSSLATGTAIASVTRESRKPRLSDPPLPPEPPGEADARTRCAALRRCRGVQACVRGVRRSDAPGRVTGAPAGAASSGVMRALRTRRAARNRLPRSGAAVAQRGGGGPASATRHDSRAPSVFAVSASRASRAIRDHRLRR